MDFAWNIQKNKMQDVKGLEMEQERKGRISNPDIDANRTMWNFDFVEDDRTLYKRVKDRVEEVRSVSRIQKNSVVDFSNIITVPKETFKEWGLDKSKQYLKDVYEYFCMEFGKENVVSAKVHLDETTPHMHLHFVPVNKSNGKLQARSIVTPIVVNKIHTEAPKFLQGKGYEVYRGEGSTKNSLKIEKFKLEKTKEEVQGLEGELKALEAKIRAYNEVSVSVDKLDSIEVKKSVLGGKISVKEEDYKMLLGLAKDNTYTNIVLREVEADLEKEKEVRVKLEKDLKDTALKYKKQISDLENKISKLEKNLANSEKKVKGANKTLRAMSKEAQNEFKEIYKEFQEQEKSVEVKTKNKIDEIEIGN